MIIEICRQVEAEYGVSSFPATVKKDPLLIALEARIQVLRSEKGESRWIAMARRSVEITSTRVLGSPIVTNLDTDNVSQLLASDESHIAQLLALHGADAQPLLVEHMDKVAYETDPVEVGSFQMRMPPMVGHGDIAIPHVFLTQVYSKSVAFGYALASARERRALEATLLRPLPEIVEVGDDDVPFPLCEPQDPQQQLRGRDVAPAASPVAEPACPALATFLYTGWWRSQALQMDRASPALALAQQHTEALFGHPAKLAVEVDRAMRFATSPEEAQESLDHAMCTGGIPWLRVPASGLRRLIAEALAYGAILNAVETMLPNLEGFSSYDDGSAAA